MKLFGRVALLCCWTALVGCGGTETPTPTEVQGSALPSPTCPQIVQPGPGFCEDGTIVPVYEGKCLVSYQCDRTVTATALPSPTCPQLVPPGPGFCEFGTIVPVYEGKCIVAYDCI